MKSFSEFLGVTARIEALHRALQGGQFVHALLFLGPEGSGKRSIAELCALTLHCVSEDSARPCGCCAGCRAVLEHEHPDDLVLEARGVDDVRELLDTLSLKAFSSRARTVRIPRADALTPQAQNALLKTLEEPVANTFFLLGASDASAVLPTVRSRSQLFRMPVVSEIDIHRLLTERGVSGERLETALHLSGGVVGRALSLADDDRVLACRAQAIGLLSGTVERLRALREIEAAKMDVDTVLRILEALLHSALKDPASRHWASARLTPQEKIAALRAVEIGRRRLTSYVMASTVLTEVADHLG